MAREQLISLDLGRPGQFLWLYSSVPVNHRKTEFQSQKEKPGAHLYPKEVDSPHP